MTYRDYDKAWEDHAWEEMRKLLDRELPVQRRRRLGAWWIFVAGVAAGLFLAGLAFFWLSPNETSAPPGALPLPMIPGADETLPAPPTPASAPAVASLPQAGAGEQTTRPRPMSPLSSARPASIPPQPPATNTPPLGTPSEPAAHPALTPTQALPAPPLAHVRTVAGPAVALPVAAPPFHARWETSFYAHAGSGSAQVLGLGLSRLQQRPGRHWQWGYALGWRYRHSRSSGLAVVAFEEDLQEQANQFSNKAIAGHFRTWHLAEGALFAERQFAPRWALGTEIYASLLLATTPTHAGLLQGRHEATTALDSQPTGPASQTEAELRALVSRSVAPLRIGAGLYLRYAATPRLDLLMHVRQQWTDDFPRNGLPDRPWSVALGARFHLQR